MSSALWLVGVWLHDCRSRRHERRAQRQTSEPAPVLAEARALINQDKPPRRSRSSSRSTLRTPPTSRSCWASPTTTPTITRHAIEQLAPIADTLPPGSIERREAVQVLGLSLLPRRPLRRAVPLLEATREWAADNVELGYVLGQAYIQTRQPDRARQTFARIVQRADGFGGRASARGADDDPARARGARRSGAEDARSRRTRSCRRRTACSGQIAIFRGRLDEAVALTERELAINPAQRDGVLPARRRARPARQVGRGDRRAAEVDLDQPVLQRALHPARQGLHAEGSARDGRGHADARDRVRPEQPVGALSARRSCCSRRDARRGEARVRDCGAAAGRSGR